ncbi:NAD-dependent succinate-semialdehyde dehydrogenase [Rhodococcoides fascians]|uniref:NAD-dependent succinate-semialdehyde dehydrogenase n=1 Tax=Rhodococcoides fascians TaxID=1828 RepID=UPI00055D3D26|nr:NAD-dependent succinate-semialdehyde dehydrogenase [Rhodococcus fascians]
MSASTIETRQRLWIAGKWVPGDAGQTFDVIDPATGETVGACADGNAIDARRALDAAVAVADAWATTPARTRAEILRRVFDAIVYRSEEFAALITTEAGKPLDESRAEVAYGAEFFRWFSEEAARIAGRYGPNPEGTGEVVVTHRPVGPCYLVTPWNFPLAMAARKIAPALAAGCTAVVKPADLTPLTTLLLCDVLAEAGVPDGVVNVVTTTDPAAVSDALMGDSRLRKVSFTGSTGVGRQLIAQSAQHVLRTSMELGGNAPFLVFGDADLDAAVAGALVAKFRNVGQACTAANRFFVHSSLVDSFVERVTAAVEAMTVGAGNSPGVTIGPLISNRAAANVARMVADAQARGARLRTGGTRVDRPGFFYAPTVLDHVPADSEVMQQEIFGPVMAVTSFETEDEAVEAANNTEYGLVAYAYTRDLALAHRLIDRLETGMLGLNTGVVSNAAAPFGGLKSSGLGREGGVEGIAEYLSSTYALIAR